MRAASKREEQKLEQLKKLFEGCVFFLSREVPREALTFTIRSACVVGSNLIIYCHTCTHSSGVSEGRHRGTLPQPKVPVTLNQTSALPTTWSIAPYRVTDSWAGEQCACVGGPYSDV